MVRSGHWHCLVENLVKIWDCSLTRSWVVWSNHGHGARAARPQGGGRSVQKMGHSDGRGIRCGYLWGTVNLIRPFCWMCVRNNSEAVQNGHSCESTEKYQYFKLKSVSINDICASSRLRKLSGDPQEALAWMSCLTYVTLCLVLQAAW